MQTRLVIMDEAPSTQDPARESIAAGEPEGFAVMALSQTAGRGSGARSWISPPGKNLALSLVLRPSIAANQAALLGLLASVAAAEAVEELTEIRCALKWPNDVMVGERKLAGILSEASLVGARLEYVIVGLGMNVNTGKDDLPTDLRTPATSLLMETGRETDVESVARAFLKTTALLYERVSAEGCGFIPHIWLTRWAHKGRMMSRNGLTGIAEGIDRDGALLLRNPTGDLERITSGDAVPMES